MTRRIFIGNGLSCASHGSPVKLCGRTSKTRLSRAKKRSRASVSRQILHSSWAQMKCGSNCASVRAFLMPVPSDDPRRPVSIRKSFKWQSLCGARLTTRAVAPKTAGRAPSFATIWGPSGIARRAPNSGPSGGPTGIHGVPLYFCPIKLRQESC